MYMCSHVFFILFYFILKAQHWAKWIAQSTSITDNVVPSNNRDMAQNVSSQRSWSWKMKVEGQYRWNHKNPWFSNHMSRYQTHYVTWFSANVMVKNIFLQNDGLGQTEWFHSWQEKSLWLCWKGREQPIHHNTFYLPPIFKNGGRYCFGVRCRIRRLSPRFALYLGGY